MAFPTILQPPPSVPSGAGVPPLARATSIVNNAVLLVADAADILNSLKGPSWGIFDANYKPIIVGDSVVGIDYRKSSHLADYPVEQGGFSTYNKVAEPFSIRVTFATSGKGSILSSLLSGGVIGSILTGTTKARAARADFLTNLEDLASTTDRFQVVTPEFTYRSCSIMHHDYRREARRGVSLILVDVWLEEIRVTATATFSNTAQPSGADPVSGGTVQPQTPTPDQSKAFSSQTIAT